MEQQEIKTTLKFSESYYVFITNNEYEKLFAIQSFPTVKYFFKDREVTVEEIIEILSNAQIPNK